MLIIGVNTTVPAETLMTIRPTLKSTKEDKEKHSDMKMTNDRMRTGSVKSNNESVKPAEKKDCVFDITSENFQKLVIESPVPVILDIYADCTSFSIPS
jgi:hypothetical protein